MLTVFRILYFISAFFNLFAGILFDDDDGYSSRIRQSSPIKRMLAWLGFPLVFVWKLLQTFLAPVFRWVPENVKGQIRYSFRSAGRWVWHKSSFAASKVNPMEIRLPRYLQKSKTSDEKLAQMLLAELPYDVLQLIAAKVHYVDLVNLSLVSKKVRAIMFPGLEDSTEDRQLRFHSCRGNEKSTCWICGVQVCEVSRLLPLSLSKANTLAGLLEEQKRRREHNILAHAPLRSPMLKMLSRDSLTPSQRKALM
jgi:hypothetical protein